MPCTAERARESALPAESSFCVMVCLTSWMIWRTSVAADFHRCSTWW
ncbi:hypothetical protein [Saccharopolyspora gregorii]